MSIMSKRNLLDASTLTADRTYTTDVVIIGTGAGGGYTAEVLTKAGLKVIMVEEGAYHTAKTFSQNEAEATAMLYQQGGAQKTKDKGIVVLQGRCVGGGTTVNWTSSIRTPANTLKHWREHHGLKVFSDDELAPYFTEVEKRLNMNPFEEFEPNANNSILAKGCAALGYEWHRINRNVNGCANSGLCGLGCPINAKQSQMVTTIPWALDNGAMLISKARADRLIHDGQKISTVEITALDTSAVNDTNHKITITAKHFVIAAGAMRSPALLMKSQIPDPSSMLGKRTFLHPVIAVAAEFEHKIDGFYGAPQTVNSHEFLWPKQTSKNPNDNKMGFKLETIPVTPMLASAFFDKGIGKSHASRMKSLPHLNVIDALCRDGFNDTEACGTVEIDSNGNPTLDYPITQTLIETARNVIDKVFEIQFAAGAKTVSAWHIGNPKFTTLKAAKSWLKTADLGLLKGMYGSAHVMGGCQMGKDEKSGVVDTNGRHFTIKNLSIHDASIFPSSTGVNPQLSIYATTLRNTKNLTKHLT